MAVAVLERESSYRHPEFISGSNKMLNQVQHDNKELTFLERNLQEEIDHLRNNWQKEKLPKNWVDLPGVGFMLGYQMGFLDSPKLKDLSLERKKELWISLTEYSLRSWIGEYLVQDPVLPGLLRFRFENGRYILKDPLHGAGFNLAETLSKKERNGVVYDTYVNKIAPFFKIGRLAVVNSTHGDGLPDEDGVMIKYPESRLTVLKMQENGEDIPTYTICNDFDYQEHGELMTRLYTLSGQKDPHLTKDSSPEDFMASPALFDGSTVTQIEDIVEIMAKIRAKKNTRRIYRDKTIDDVLAAAKDWNKLWDYDDVTKTFINQWVDYSRSLKDWSYKNVKEALAATILRLSRYVLRKEEEKKIRTLYPELPQNVIPFDPRLMDGYSFGGALRNVAKIPGCAGGGTKDKRSFAYQFNRAFKTILGGDDDGEWFECVCGWKADGPIGDGACQKCGLTKKKAEEEGMPVCK